MGWTFFKIGLFSFGGGYAMLTMIQQEVVLKHNWLTHQQLTDMIAVSQMTPGPIAINVATFIGYRQAGFGGAFFTTLGVVLPSLMLMFLITLTYIKLKRKAWFASILKELRPLIIGLIAAAAWLTAETAFVDFFSVIIFIACFSVSLKYRINPLVVLLFSGLAGLLVG